MRQSLPAVESTENCSSSQLHWVLLPGLCCQGAGGRSEQADEVAAAWLLLYSSAHILDCVEDNDLPDIWWSETGPSIAINVASGLIFRAFFCLNSLFENGNSIDTARQIVAGFSKSLLEMSSGQHGDLVETNLGRDDWFKIAQAKSGSFFALACRSGAQLATRDSERIKGFSDFGNHLGILLQILDDLEDFNSVQSEEVSTLPANFARSLAILYALDVNPTTWKIVFNQAVEAAMKDRSAVPDVVNMLDQCGAGLYLATEIERQRQSGLNALDLASPEKDIKVELTTMLNELVGV